MFDSRKKANEKCESEERREQHDREAEYKKKKHVMVDTSAYESF
jgi:hypothetical protein